ncbi:MAG TPA: nuclear transport factor 2 family protein [Bryobacteraceae bacterium]|nr:nuclear transport factor 2 family protein [Bryobacteraceae bacterium]
MTKRFACVALLAVLAALVAETSDEAAVRTAHEAYMKAARDGDRATLEKLFSDRLQYSHSNANVETKQQAIDALIKGKNNFELHSQTINVYDGKVATIRAKVTAHLPAGDIPLSMLQVWVKGGGNWQLVERQTTRLPAAQ